jgi:hypothetical protein
VSNPERGPFRRFPWVQLVFCLACLSMAAWTWMRYSYLWELTPEILSRASLDGDPRLGRHELPWYLGTHVRLRAVVEETNKSMNSDPPSFLCGLSSAGGVVHVGMCLEGDATSRLQDALMHGPKPELDVVGRMAVDTLDATSPGRLHGASIAGLVVGAMGVFIFGLYLRRWLCERKATA